MSNSTPQYRRSTHGARFSHVFLLFLLYVLAVPARADGLNDTGIDTCYDDNHPGQDCRHGRDAAAATGQLSKAGAGVKGFDFTKIANNGAELGASATLGGAANDWACTRDNVTDLTWEIKTTGPTDLRFFGHRYFWYNTNGAENGGNTGSQGVVNTCNGTLPFNQCNTQALITAVNATSLCGYTDWRLPTPRELRTIINYGDGKSISVDPLYFPNTPLNRALATAATYAPDPRDTWVVEIGQYDGGGGGHNHSKTGNDHSTGDEHTLLVRGAKSVASQGTCSAGNPNFNLLESTPSGAFIDNGNGTVTHVTTGLMWKRCAEGLSGETCATGVPTNPSWSDALAAAANSTFAGFTDWRLPNIKELQSIVETCGYDPATNQNIFPASPSAASSTLFWSASTDVYNPANAWIILFERGGGVATDKASRLSVRLVRRGQSFGITSPSPQAIAGATFNGQSDPVANSTSLYAIGMTLNNGSTYTTTAWDQEDVKIVGHINPEPQHLGQRADIFVVDRVNLAFTMKNLSGVWEPWNGRVPDLVPFREDVMLTNNLAVDIFTGRLGTAGDHRVFIGYAGPDGKLRYTPTPLRLTINP